MIETKVLLSKLIIIWLNLTIDWKNITLLKNDYQYISSSNRFSRCFYKRRGAYS